jgi:hypothetical protein
VTREQLNGWLRPLAVALVVGAGSGLLTSWASLQVLEDRVTTHEARLDRVEVETGTYDEAYVGVVQRLAAIEAKLDMLLERRE